MVFDMIGRTISHYKILEKLGEGGMGVVYKAEDTKLKRTVALKFLPPELTRDVELKERLVHEAQAAAGLDHPNICTVYEIDEVDGKTFIAMAYVEGRSLKEEIRSGPLKLDEAIDLAVQIAEGLEAAHKKDIVHRDIKPANLMVTDMGQVKIMDFGLAKSRGQTALTKADTTLGTFAYMSPQQARGEVVDHRTDIWSLGVVLYEMTTGQRPFNGDYEQAVVYSILNEEPEPMTGLRTGVPVELERVVTKALAKDPGRRYPRADDLLVDLRELRNRPIAPAAKRGPSFRRRVLFGTVAAVAVAAAALLGVRIQVGRQAPAIAEENSLAILYFDNVTDPNDPDRLGEIITNLLITDLSESKYVQVLSSQRLYDILKLLGKQDVRSIDRAVASQVAEKAHVKWMLLGSILQVEPRLVVTSQLVEVASGRVKASQRTESEREEDIFALVDRLTVEIKNDLSLPEAALIEPDRAVSDVTTHSAEAYRLYLEGLESEDRFYLEEAEESYRKAVETDTSFAMAYLRLGLLGGQHTDRVRWARKALRHADHVGRKERAYIEAVATFVIGDPKEAIRKLEAYVERYPDEKEAFLELGSIYFVEMNEHEAAVRAFVRATEIDPLYAAPYNILAYAYELLDEYDKSIWAINQYISLAPEDPNPYDSRGELYGFQGKIDAAIESFRKALEICPDFYSSLEALGYMYLIKREYARAESCYQQLVQSRHEQVRSQGRSCLALIPFHQGRFRETLRVLQDGIAADRLEGVGGDMIALKYVLRAGILTLIGERFQAEEEVERFLNLGIQVSPWGLRSFQAWYAEALAGFGDGDAARKVLEELRAEIESQSPGDLRVYLRAKGAVELALGNPQSAIEYLETSARLYYQPPIEVRYLLGKAFLETGQVDRAVDVLENALTRHDADSVTFLARFVRVHYLLGQAYERSGWHRKAIGEYETFLEIWKGADPGIPEVEDARDRLQKLRAAGAG